MSLSAVILAAGKSTRMKSALPKPLHEVCGKPMLGWLVDACFAAGMERVVIVVGHEKDRVISGILADALPQDRDKISFVEQTEQLGTGHAVKVAVPALPTSGDVIVLAGDLPMIRHDELEVLAENHEQAGAAVSLASANLTNPFGYGRIVRNDEGEFLRIVEQLDATPEQEEIQEVFPSVTCARADVLAQTLSKLSNDNAKGEYYFTDIFELARNDGGKIVAFPLLGDIDVIAPNDRKQLVEANAAMQRRIQQQHLDFSQISIVDPRTTWIEAGVTIGRDTTLLPFSFIGRGATVGSNCTIGPFGRIDPHGMVKDGTAVTGNATSSEGGLP
jgi:bifunctional UDP-N-acetylglucosamine pyrophosphorylase/glucosamine-1-phosphate N-acetyltransferase